MTDRRTSTGIVATGSSGPSSGLAPPAEHIFQAVTQALLGSTFGVDDVDVVVNAGSDIVDGRSISNVSFVEHLGAQRKDEWRVEEDGIFAMQFADHLLAAGAGNVALVVAYGNNTELSMAQYWNLVTTPFLERQLGLTQTAATSLQRRTYLRHFGVEEQRLAGVGLEGTISHADGAVALVVASEEVLARQRLRPLAWVRANGQATETHVFAERELWRSASAARAWSMLLSDAGYGLGLADLARVELSAYRDHEMALLLEAMGMAGPGEGAEVLSSPAAEAVNSVLAASRTSIVPANGLLSVAAAASALSGTDGADLAVAHGSSGLALQKSGFVLLGKEPR